MKTGKLEFPYHIQIKTDLMKILHTGHIIQKQWKHRRKTPTRKP